MAQAIGPDYGQQFLFSPALEDWVARDSPARFTRELVDPPDLAALGFVMPAATEGRAPYHPSLPLKFWLYGHFHRIRSGPGIARRATADHLGLMRFDKRDDLHHRTALTAPDGIGLVHLLDERRPSLAGLSRRG